MVRDRINAALKPLADQLGLKINLGSITYGEFNLRGKLEVTVNTPEAQESLIPSWVPINKSVSFNGSIFTITGYRERSFKYPIIATKKSDGRSYKLPRHVVNDIINS